MEALCTFVECTLFLSSRLRWSGLAKVNFNINQRERMSEKTRRKEDDEKMASSLRSSRDGRNNTHVQIAHWMNVLKWLNCSVSFAKINSKSLVIFPFCLLIRLTYKTLDQLYSTVSTLRTVFTIIVCVYLVVGTCVYFGFRWIVRGPACSGEARPLDRDQSMCKNRSLLLWSCLAS